jgi:uncharacterized oligopeptide transporter (OPT) family protein
VIAETPYYARNKSISFSLPQKFPEKLPNMVGCVVGPKIAGVLVAGSVLSWLVFIPLMSTLVPGEIIATQLAKLGSWPIYKSRR